ARRDLGVTWLTDDRHRPRRHDATDRGDIFNCKFLLAKRQSGIDIGLDHVRAGIELGLRRGALPDRSQAVDERGKIDVGVAKKSAVKPESMIEPLAWAAEPGAGELCGDQTSVRRPAGVHPFRPAAIA